MIKYLKLFCLNFVLIVNASVIHVPQKTQNAILDSAPNRDLDQIFTKWEGHIDDFVKLIDVGEVSNVVSKYINDPDVINFMGFIASSQFKDIVLQLESLEEFKEAVDYLESKGYEVKSIIELTNSLLTLSTYKAQGISKNGGNAVTNLVKEVIKTLPIEDMKVLLKMKIDNNVEVAELFQTLSSDEFADILARLTVNPKAVEIRKVLKDYGLDIGELSSFADDIIGDYFEKIKGMKYV